MIASESYLEVCVPAPEEGLSGAIVARWIRRIITPMNHSWVVLTDIDISGEVRESLSICAQEVHIMRTSEALVLLERAVQVVWATLFFVPDASSAATILPSDTYHESTNKAKLVVRIVDGGFMYIIGRASEAALWKDLFPHAESHTRALADLTFPE